MLAIPRLRMRHDRVREVRVGLDAARHHDQARGVDHARRVLRQRPGLGEGGDALALDTHVPGAYALGRHDTSAADHEIKHAQSLAHAARAVK
jgi:hypothetical protein